MQYHPVKLNIKCYQGKTIGKLKGLSYLSHMRKHLHADVFSEAGAVQGIVERGFRCVKEGFPLLILSHFSYTSHKNEIIWSQ